MAMICEASYQSACWMAPANLKLIDRSLASHDSGMRSAGSMEDAAGT
eukprot:CAMPEP_0202858376 /NCGR_PEP_ID=MMETSP1391-20130828/942_1 /ASSEMBLY_ACC=CAM_ASM_000867 /TAXON_ID=1034604 /ORGANISM="Chlamydomonas leiostraca, Strain SAG 11-49" /LENGTH=46 /DNA_ID= /DNA_START= /DNA_END= /DNA_ORIENTATION=